MTVYYHLGVADLEKPITVLLVTIRYIDKVLTVLKRFDICNNFTFNCIGNLCQSGIFNPSV